MMPFAKLFFLDPEGGSQTTLYCALQEGIEPFSGRYFSNCALQEVGAKGRDDALARKLWEVSERLTSFPWETKSQSRSSNLKRPPVLMSYWLSRCMMQWVFWIMTEHKAVQCFTISNLHNLSLAAVHQIAGFQKDILIMIIIISLNHFFLIFFFYYIASVSGHLYHYWHVWITLLVGGLSLWVAKQGEMLLWPV